MTLKNEKRNMIFAGLVIGVIASLLVLFGNPKNMGFCVACFLRDTAGALGLHSAEAVQYIRPEIIGLVFGSFFMALAKKEFSPRGGSAPVTRFVLGMFVMIGSLMFLGCPFRMILRLAGGDLNALLGLAGFACGILVGVFFLNKGYSLKRSYALTKAEGGRVSRPDARGSGAAACGPGIHPLYRSRKWTRRDARAPSYQPDRGLVVGALAQRTRLCMVGGIRDLVLFKETKLILGFAAILVGALVCNLILSGTTGTSYFHLGFADQPVAHTDSLWNFLGMMLTGFACVLLGGCPLRQLILSGEGSSDSAVTVFGLLAGAAFCHNFGLASSAKGPTSGGKAAVIIGLVAALVIAGVNTFKKENAK